MNWKRFALALLSLAALFNVMPRASAQQPGNVWHIPRNAEPAGVAGMRNPPSAITPATAVSFYNGSYSLDGNQAGGQLFYRTTTDALWSTATLVFDTQAGDNKYWRTTIPAGTFSAGSVVQYFFRIDFTERPQTYIYGNDSMSLRTVLMSQAQAAPFTYRVTVPWPGGGAAGYPSDPASRIHHWKEEAVIGNGYITCMLDQNGSLYDIYFPSAGNHQGAGTANEGYRGPEEFPNCPLDQQANGQMNVINGMGGIGIGGAIYWMKNQNGTDYADVEQRYVTNNNVVFTRARLNAPGNSIRVDQYDFCPVPSALPIVASGDRTNYGVYVKRFRLENLEATGRTIDFYYDVNFNINGANQHDGMLFDTAGGRNTMVAYDNTARNVTGGGCGPNGYDVEYKPASYGGDYVKNLSIYFSTAMKLVTNAVTGAGSPADGSWRDHSATDNQEGWIGKRVTLPPGQIVEVDVLIVGSWDDFAGATGTHNFWGRPVVDWFYTNSMSAAQTATEAYWTSWLASGVTTDFPGDVYDALFKRSLLISALHVDRASGSIIAGMHNGAYPFVWPRDLVYAAISFARTGHLQESEDAYRWLRDTAYRDNDPNLGGEKGFFYQKYSTDGYQIWTSPQVDETASVPWGVYYHYLLTGDAGWLGSHWDLVRSSARASSEDSGLDSRLNYNDTFNLMDGNNAWEDSFGLFLYSNGSVVRGLRDAALVAAQLGQAPWVSTFQNRATTIRDSGIIPRINARVEPSDISHLGLVHPYEVFTPADPLMTNMMEWIHGRQSAGGFNDNLVESDPDIAGLLRRYNHKVSGGIDDYWNGGPWFLATSWYGMYHARWQDYVGGSNLVTTNLVLLDKLIAKLGPMGLGAEQIAPNPAKQKYPDFWLQAAWPNVWESHTTMLDQMMAFLDYRPETNRCSFAPKFPAGWTRMAFSNLVYRGQRFDVVVQQTAGDVTAIVNKRTAGPLEVEFFLRIPAGEYPGILTRNAVMTGAPPGSYDTNTGRVRIAGPLNAATGGNLLRVTFGPGDADHDGLPDAWENQYGLDPLSTTNPDGGKGDPDGDGFENYQEYGAGTNPTDANSLLRITRASDGGQTITWLSVPGRTYQVYSSTNVAMPFTLLSTNIPATGNSTSYTDTTPIVPTRHYRVRIVP